jgi:DUF1009 family protein
MSAQESLIDNVYEAIEMTQIRLLKIPAYGVYLHALEQLQMIQTKVMAGVRPDEHDKAQIDIGLMAVKELEAVEPDYADKLCMVDYLYKRL